MKTDFSSCSRGIIAAGIFAISLLARPAAAQDCDLLRPSHPDSPFNVGQSVTSRLSQAGNFRVWYALDGEHAPPDASEAMPAYVVEVLSIAEQAHAHYDSLGYAAAVSDQLVPCAAHDAAIDIYLMNFGGSADGTKVDEACGEPSAESCSGFLIVENDFAGYGYPDQRTALRTVVPHEYFHLIQARYDARIEPWFAEAGAQWATDNLYPDLADMERFFPVFFKQPERSLDSASGGAAASYSYSTALFAVFLEEAYSASLMRESLEQLEAQGPPSTAAIDTALGAGHHSDLQEAFQRFALWNAATGTRASSGGYTDASSYPEIALTEVTAPTTIAGTTISLSSHYYAVTLPRFEVSVDTDDARNRVWYVPFEADGTTLELEAARELAVPAPLGPGFVVVVGVTTARSDARFELVVSELASEPLDAGAGADAAADAGTLEDAADPDAGTTGDAGTQRLGR
ncbi:MAG: MXAN_6640 family putative metalloprotease, partial [Polyangiaceae bacterium]